MTDLLLRYQQAYYVQAQPLVSDREFDRLFDRLTELERLYPQYKRPESPTSRIGSDLAAELPEIEHSIPVLSLDKAYSPAEVFAWMKKIEARADSEGAAGVEFVLEEKIDGVSIVLYYEDGMLVRAVTRGNGTVGNDITANVKTIGAVPLRLDEPLTGAVRGEIYLPLAEFKSINRDLGELYANPRNLAAGTLRRIKSRETARIPLNIYIYEGFFGNRFANHFELLRYLADLGFRTNPRTRLIGTEEIQEGKIGEYLEKAATERGQLPYEIDGLVLKVNQLGLRQELGYTGHHPRWALAYKFESPQGVSQVTDIEVQVGRTGRITPVARIEPVFIGGSTVSNVTLHNQDYIEQLELNRGDRVAVSKRGDVIPAVDKVLEKGDGGLSWRLPGECPSCGALLVRRGAHHFCPNKECPAQKKGRLLFFIGKGQMDIENLGPETVEFLWQKGYVRSIPGLFRFDWDRLVGEAGFGEKKSALIRSGLEQCRAKPFKKVLSSLGIPELGPRMAELLIENGFDSMDRILQAAAGGDSSRFTAIPGIGEKIAETLIRWFQDRDTLTLIDELREAGLSFEERESQAGSEAGALSGQVWCITGRLERFQPREAAAEEIKRRGGRTVSQVTSATTHLLAGEGGGGKRKKAEKLEIPVVSEEEFIAILEGAPT